MNEINEPAKVYQFPPEARASRREGAGKRAVATRTLRAAARADMSGATDLDVIEGMLGRGETARGVAEALFATFGDLPSIVGAAPERLAMVDGMNATMVTTFLSCQEAAVRVAKGQFVKRCAITSMTALIAYARTVMATATTEQFRVLFLDRKNQLIADEVMNHGTVDHAPVYPREVAKRALLLDASSVILAHNHPSGDPSPSSADVHMTRQVVDALRPLNINVHDHIVVGRHGVESLKALGMM